MPRKKTVKNNAQLQTLSQALNKLEKIVNDLDSDTIDIEKSLAKFKEGSDLIKFCKEKFKKAENEFTQLKKDLENELQD